MTKDEVMKELNQIFRNNFADDSINLTENTTAEDIEDWDSLEQINLLLACEKNFHIKFNFDDVANLKNVGEMAMLILEKIK
ncbi:MAG: phosphopantetheine-binding protein [Ruminococcus flavefaciens]|nr:phosphopantetheine-binding protein [Ruminococcus flavefaciens]